MNYRGSFDGVELVISDVMQYPVSYQFRRPKSKRRRIRKKWRKDPRNWRTRLEGPECIQVCGRFVCTRAFYERITTEGMAGIPGGVLFPGGAT